MSGNVGMFWECLGMLECSGNVWEFLECSGMCRVYFSLREGFLLLVFCFVFVQLFTGGRKGSVVA